MEEKAVDMEKIIKEMDGDVVKAIQAAKKAWERAGGQKLTDCYVNKIERERLDELYKHSGMSELDIETKTFDTFEVRIPNRRAYSLVNAYLQGYPLSAGEGCGFIIMGGVGVGKTHLCLAFLVEFIRRYSVFCKYANVKTTLDQEKESFEGHGPGPLEGLKRVPVLFLDDLGSERATSWTVDAISSLVTYRYMKYLPTIFTTNALDFGSLAKSFSGSWGNIAAERIVDRIVERSEAALIEGKSRRKALVRLLRGRAR